MAFTPIHLGPGFCWALGKTYFRVANSLVAALFFASLFATTNSPAQTSALGASLGLGSNSSSSSTLGGVNNAPLVCTKLSPSGEPVCQQAVANPINVTSGNKFQREVDMAALPGVLGLEIVRFYNSSTSQLNTPPSMMGRGWRLSYDWALRFDHANHNETMILIQGDGTELPLRKQRRNSEHGLQNYWRVLGGVRGKLSETRGPQGSQYQWRDSQGARYHFNGLGRLMGIEAPSGETLIIERTANGDITQVTDPQGRTLKMTLLSDQVALRETRFGGVQAIDSPVGRFAYQYGGSSPKGSSVEPIRLASRLLAVKYEQVTRHYVYEDPRYPTLLTGIRVVGQGNDGVALNQRLVTWGYDPQGRAVFSVKGEKTSREELVQLSFLPVRKSHQGPYAGHLLGETLLTNSLSQVTRYRYVTLWGKPQITEIIGPGCASCEASNVRFAYDAKGRRTHQSRLDSRGRELDTILTEYDDQDRPIRISRLARDPGVRDGSRPSSQPIERFEYADELSNQPNRIARPSVVTGREHQFSIDYNQRGQVLQVIESGHSPLKHSGGLAANAEQATEIARTTQYQYVMINGQSLLSLMVGPLGSADASITAFEYNTSGSRLVALRKPGGIKHRLAYDEAGRIQQVKDEEGSETTLNYGGQHLIAMSQGGRGWVQPRVHRFKYDALGRLSETGDGNLQLGKTGDITAESTGEAKAAAETFRALSRHAYDDAGRLLWTASALGVLNLHRYDTESQLLETVQSSNRIALKTQYAPTNYAPTNYASTETPLETLQQSAKRAPTFLPDSGGVLKYIDDFGRIVAVKSPDSGLSIRRFDAANRLTNYTDAQGHQATYRYDERGRIVQQTVIEAGSAVETQTNWRYQGQLLMALEHPTQDEQYQYDARGLRVAKTIIIKPSAIALTTSYRYNEAGVLESTSLADGTALAYARNGQGQVVAMHRTRPEQSWLGQQIKQLARLGGHANTTVIAENIQRDLVGLSRYTAGNGIRAQYERSLEGKLARVVYRQAGLETSQADVLKVNNAPASKLPGALSLPNDLSAFIDHRYLWDPVGNLILTVSKQGQQSYAYDRAHRLIAANTTEGERLRVNRYFYGAARRLLAQENVEESDTSSTHQQASQHPAASPRLVAKGFERAAFAPGERHASNDGVYNLNGQPERLGDRAGNNEIGIRHFKWDALGRLTSIEKDGRALASYRYNHRGERIVKTLSPTESKAVQTYYLYENGLLTAELNSQGKLSRQYLYLGEQALAVIDTPEGRSLAKPIRREAGGSGVSSLIDKARSYLDTSLGLIKSSFSESSNKEQVYWLHTNHLGAPEAATNASGRVIWNAHYAPFGAATVGGDAGDARGGRTFVLNLRLPGQYADHESGLHYNKQRYYDPKRGEYLTPDPLGTRDGPNPYSYVRYNPLRYVDPEGLALFAFDGTENAITVAELARLGGSISNVARFRDVYDDGGTRYMSGVGTLHEDAIWGNIEDKPLDSGTNRTGPERIDRMLTYMMEEANLAEQDNVYMNVDIVGFSRGAAQARDFANIITSMTNSSGWFSYGTFKKQANGAWRRFEGSQCVKFRFMGLFDTVLSSNLGRNYKLSIPAEFGYVAHAVALNEYRHDATPWDATRINLPGKKHWGGFPLESIGASSTTPGQIRIERGFLGAHADIGGGYAESENQLSFVALNWMVAQARLAGIKLDNPRNEIPLADPVLHDQSNAILVGNPVARPATSVRDGRELRPVTIEDRSVRGAFRGDSARTLGFNNNSMVNADTHALIRYYDRPAVTTTEDLKTLIGNRTGLVDIKAYMKWLQSHGYCFAGDSCAKP
jgi:RHS repeat-associated protein